MRKNIRTIIGIAFVSALVLTASCKGKAEEKNETSTEATMDHDMDHMNHDMDSMDHKDHNMGNMETADKQGKEYTSKYVCQMHCEGSGSDEEGKCPVCGMTYVLNEDYKMDENMGN